MVIYVQFWGGKEMGQGKVAIFVLVRFQLSL